MHSKRWGQLMTCMIVGNFKRGFTFRLDKRRMESQVVKLLKKVAFIYSTGMTEYHLWEGMLLKRVTSYIVLYFVENYTPKLVITLGFEMTGCHE